MNTNEPKPMTPERLAQLRDLIASFPIGAAGGFLVTELLGLQADRDYQEQRAEQAERERDEARAEIEGLRVALGFGAEEEPDDVASKFAALCEQLKIADAVAADLWVAEQHVKDVEAERDEAEAEVARLRARVPVEAEDVGRAGVTRAHVEAWLGKQNSWAQMVPGTWKHSAWPGHNAKVREGVDAWTVNQIASLSGRPSLVVLDEMAAMPLETER